MSPASATAQPPDLTVRPGAVPVALPDATAEGPTWQIAGEQFLLRVPGIARFLLTGGSAVTFEPEPQADPDDIPAFLSGTVLGILLHQRGQIVLHASAVALNGKAVLPHFGLLPDPAELETMRLACRSDAKTPCMPFAADSAAKQAAASDNLRALSQRHLADIIRRLDAIAATPADREASTLL